MKYRFELVMIAALLVFAACGGKDKPPLTPDGPEADTSQSDAGTSTMPAPDPYNK